MSAQAAESRLQFDIARAEIDSWRGQCLDIFARAGRAISNWHASDEKRAFLAHGVDDGAIDRQGQWWAMLDLRHYNKGTAVSERWTLSKVEAGDFQTLLAKAFDALSGQLRQFRARLSR